MHLLYQTLWNPEKFLDSIFENLEQTWIDVSNFELDHICYRTETLDEYERLKQEISKHAKLLIENIIWGRNIATYELFIPFQYKNRIIRLLELPAPKQGSKYSSWYEHVEFVTWVTPQNFMEKYPEIEFDTRALHMPVNNDISLDFWKVSVKFHQFPLDYIIKNFEQ
jgi:hypothetical protein